MNDFTGIVQKIIDRTQVGDSNGIVSAGTAQRNWKSSKPSLTKFTA